MFYKTNPNRQTHQPQPQLDFSSDFIFETAERDHFIRITDIDVKHGNYVLDYIEPVDDREAHTVATARVFAPNVFDINFINLFTVAQVEAVEHVKVISSRVNLFVLTSYQKDARNLGGYLPVKARDLSEWNPLRYVATWLWLGIRTLNSDLGPLRHYGHHTDDFERYPTGHALSWLTDEQLDALRNA